MEKLKKTIVYDIETNALENPVHMWMALFLCLETGETWEFLYPTYLPGEYHDLSQFLQGLVDNPDVLLVGHNSIDFDNPVLKRFTGVDLNKAANTLDTLVIAKLRNYTMSGGHSLKNLAERVGSSKLDFEGPWDRYSEEMLTYCRQDVKATGQIFKRLMDTFHQWNPNYLASLQTEIKVAKILRDCHEKGFPFNREKANSLLDKTNAAILALDTAIFEAFGDLNLNSPKQIIDIMDRAGWKPVSKTKGHKAAERKNDIEEKKMERFKKYGWTLSEENFDTLPDDAPEVAKFIINRIMLEGRRRSLVSWLADFNSASGAIHSTIVPIGTWTHRCSHNSPNLGNVAAKKSIKYKREDLVNNALYYGEHMRSLFTTSSPDNWLVGVDADGIQLRILAHYINDEDFTKALVEGKASEGTDAHTMNMKALGLPHITRDNAKTFIYAWLLGASLPKVADILKCSVKEAKQANQNFLNRYPGLKDLKQNKVLVDADNGFFVSLDGRKIKCDSAHKMLAGYLQAGEQAIMKKALTLWVDKAESLDLPFQLRNFIHDEFQIESISKDRETAELIGSIAAEAISSVGDIFQLNCPLKGNFKVGKNWYETH